MVDERKWKVNGMNNEEEKKKLERVLSVQPWKDQKINLRKLSISDAPQLPKVS